MRTLVLAVAVSLVTASAWAEDFKVTIQSDPPGAMIYGTNRAGVEQPGGLTPQRLSVGLVKEDQGCRELGPIRVRWMSGAEASLADLRLCKKGKKQPVVFLRPVDAPELETDVRFALDLERDAMLRQQAFTQMLLNVPRTQPPPPLVPYVMQPMPARAVPPMVQCTSQLVGTYVYTTCQ